MTGRGTIVDQIIQTIYSKDGKKRVHIVRRANGFYGFDEEYFSEDLYEMCWIPLTSRRPFSICDSAETALREAKGRIVWLMHDLRADDL
jgi:hypothetical protein